MQKLSVIKQQAIQAAKNLDWSKAIDLNTEILSNNENDISALNRLGLAYLQLNDPKKAKNSFLKVLNIDKTNNIAKKNISRIKNNQKAWVESFTNNDFIEEPGKAKIIQLHRLAGKTVLHSLSTGKTCFLVPKSRYISVETNSKIYIGALPEDISFRLSKLIKDGNTYLCTIHSCTERHCYVHIKEDKKSKKNSHINSFPLGKNSYSSKNPNDDVIVEKNIPVQTDNTKTPSNNNIEEKLNEIAAT